MSSPRFPSPDQLFAHHEFDELQQARCEVIRAGAKAFAEMILANCPESADRTAAIRKLRECVMTANAAIALEEPRE